MSNRAWAAVLGLAFCATAPLHAEEWKHEIAPYMWGSAINGSTSIGPVSADLDLSFGDILDNLEFGFMGMYRATNGPHSITVDALYMGLGNSGRGPAGFVKADADVDQAALEATYGYELRERLVVFGGLRYNDLSTDIKITGPLGSQKASKGVDWVDPLVGAHYTIPFDEAWSLTLRGDVGGFGVGADLAWQGIATVRWQFAPNIAAAAAYRYLDVDYEDGKGAKKFVYDVATSGPALGVIFTF
jgi:opacity protein-like surface antigen